MPLNKDQIAFEVHDLTVAYGKQPVLWNLDFVIPKGKICAIIGPNGAGKSTLIKAAFGLVPTLSGWVEFLGKYYNKVYKKLAYVPQRGEVDFNFPATVFDAVLMGRYGHLGLFRRPGDTDKKKVMEALKKVGMWKLKDRHIADLSGGQQQRVFLARALVQEAEVYFLDEPFAGVDVATEKAIVVLLRELAKAGKTVLVVHHDIHTVKEYFDWCTILNVRLIANGPLKTTFTKKNLNEAYGGQLNVIDQMRQLIKDK